MARGKPAKKPAKLSRTPCVYSGEASGGFWGRIWALGPPSTHRRLYARGVTLQNKELRLLRDLDDAEGRTDA